VKVLSNALLPIGLFLAIAAAVYWLTATEPIGTTTLAVAALTFLVLGVLVRVEAKRANEEGEGEDELVHVSPTIWPLGFAVAAVVLALGIIVAPWFFVLGGILFVASAAGWLKAVARSHAGTRER
jgi:energy-converting hydrogenase Eha subunit C